jgi:hypothetical protein
MRAAEHDDNQSIESQQKLSGFLQTVQPIYA